MRMASKFQRQYCKALAIVHGASELQIAGYVKNKLHLPLEIYSRDNGRTSIQIHGLKGVLDNKIFNKPKNLLNHYDNVESSRNTPMDFKVFTIMDTDDCKNDEIREQYKNGMLFEEHWMHPYIVPIYNSPSLEDVMVGCGFLDKKLSDKEKLSTYSKLFPITSGATNFEKIKALRDRFAKCKCTNFEVFIDYCLDWAEKSKVK